MAPVGAGGGAAQRHYFSQRYSMAAHLQEKEGTTAAMEDGAASIEAARAGAALVELETDGVAYGEVALSIVMPGSPETLDRWGAELARVFGALDAKVTRETYGQLAVWFGRWPVSPIKSLVSGTRRDSSRIGVGFPVDRGSRFLIDGSGRNGRFQAHETSSCALEIGGLVEGSRLLIVENKTFDRLHWHEPERLPILKPPYGTLTAIDIDSGATRWQIVLGDTPGLREHPLLRNLDLPPLGVAGAPGGVATRGGLVFITGGGDTLYAIDASDGSETWSAPLGAFAYSNPMTYRTGGLQYVVVAAGRGQVLPCVRSCCRERRTCDESLENAGSSAGGRSAYGSGRNRRDGYDHRLRSWKELAD